MFSIGSGWIRGWKNHVIKLLWEDLWTGSTLPNVTERGALKWLGGLYFEKSWSPPHLPTLPLVFMLCLALRKLNLTNYSVMQKQSFSCSRCTGWIHEACWSSMLLGPVSETGSVKPERFFSSLPSIIPDKLATHFTSKKKPESQFKMFTILWQICYCYKGRDSKVLKFLLDPSRHWSKMSNVWFLNCGYNILSGYSDLWNTRIDSVHFSPNGHLYWKKSPQSTVEPV